MLARIGSSRKFELKINRTNSKTSKKEMKNDYSGLCQREMVLNEAAPLVCHIQKILG